MGGSQGVDILDIGGYNGGMDEVVLFLLFIGVGLGVAVNAACFYSWALLTRPDAFRWWERWGYFLLVFIPWAYPVIAVVRVVGKWLLNV